jgi:hypothetical protein
LDCKTKSVSNWHSRNKLKQQWHIINLQRIVLHY